MIFVDSNIPMYLVGADHPNTHRAGTLVETAVSRGDALVTDVEVLQEMLHRYGALRRTDAIQPAFDLTLSLVDEVLPVRLQHVERAKDILLGEYGLSARDALHLAVLGRRGDHPRHVVRRSVRLLPGDRTSGLRTITRTNP